MISAPEAALFALALVVALVIAIRAVIRWQVVLFAAVLLVTVFESTRDFGLSPPAEPVSGNGAFYIRHSGAIFSIGSAQVHISDLITLIAVGAAVTCLGNFRGNGWAGLALAALTCLVGLGVVAAAPVVDRNDGARLSPPLFFLSLFFSLVVVRPFAAAPEVPREVSLQEPTGMGEQRRPRKQWRRRFRSGGVPQRGPEGGGGRRAAEEGVDRGRRRRLRSEPGLEFE